MQNLTHAPEVTETFATEAIMDACRANPNRDIIVLPGYMGSVSFARLNDGTHEACLRNPDGVVAALANVDGFDV